MKPHRRTGRTIAALIIAAIAVPGFCWVILGMPPLQALLVGAVAVIIAGLIRFPPDSVDFGFPDPPTPVRDRGARREAFRLSWNVAGRQDRVGSTLITRLQQIGARRLNDLGLNVEQAGDRDRVIELVGPQTYRLLTLPPGSDAPSRLFEHALTAIERLVDHEPAHKHGTTWPAPKETG